MTTKGAVRKVGDGERRARLARRHRLAAAHRAGSAEEPAESLVGLHGTDPATVYLSAALRLREPDMADIERALYEDGTLVRLLAMRRTMFVVTTGTAPVVHAAAGRAIAANERKGLLKYLAEGGGWAAGRSGRAARSPGGSSPPARAAGRPPPRSRPRPRVVRTCWAPCGSLRASVRRWNANCPRSPDCPGGLNQPARGNTGSGAVSRSGSGGRRRTAPSGRTPVPPGP